MMMMCDGGGLVAGTEIFIKHALATKESHMELR